MIPYNDPDDIIVATHRDLLITDGTVTVSGTSYSVAGATVTITNELLDEEAFELHQSLCSESQIRFGACESNYITFVMHENIPTLKGKVLKVYMIPDSDASKMLQLGVFKVDTDELSADRTKRTITAYDAMYDILNADVAGWYNNLLPNSSSTVTLGQMRFAFTAYFGLTQETISLPNDSITIKRTIEPESLSGADVIRAICELEGCFGKIAPDGKFRYVVLVSDLDSGLFPSDTLYPANDLYPLDINQDVSLMSGATYMSVQFEDWQCEAITQLTIRTDDSDVGVTVGTSGNTYVITGNFLVFGFNATNLTTVATNALTNMVNRYYTPCTIEAAGNPLHEVGDGIRVSTTHRDILTYILQRTMRGIQALRDTYSASGEKKAGEQLNSIASQFKQLVNKTASLKVNVDGVRAYVEEQLDDTVQGSYAYMTEQEIGLKVSKSNIVSDLDDQMSGITIASNRITFGSTGSLVINTSNFTLGANGNATFSGTVSGAAITGSTLVCADSSNFSTQIQAALMGIYDANNTRWVHQMNRVQYYSRVPIYAEGGIYVGANRDEVLTTASTLTTIKVGQIQNTSGNGRINIDYGSSAYNIVLNGSVNIGNGSSNEIRIKGRDVKWKQYSSLASGDYVLVEA